MTSLFSKPKSPKPPPPPPRTPSMADASVQMAGDEISRGYSSLISTTASGLTRKAATVKRSLIGGT